MRLTPPPLCCEGKELAASPTKDSEELGKGKVTVPKSLLASGHRRLSLAPAPSPGLRSFPYRM